MLRASLLLRLLFSAATLLVGSASASSPNRHQRPIAGPLSDPSPSYAPFDPSLQLVWSDEFNQTDGSAPDPAVWTREVGGNGEGNHELEYYTDRNDNSYIQGGRLVIEGKQEQYKGHNFASVRLDSQGKVEVQYGFIAARARISMYDGFWPAFWLLGSQVSGVNWPRCGEMDIMEQVNGRGTGATQDDNLQFGTLHYNQYGINSTQVNHQQTGGIIKQKPKHYWGDEFHLYQALWTNTTYTFLVDDLAYETIDLTSSVAYNSFHDPANPFFFIINLALGGDFPRHTPSTGFPARFEIDWVRVWQQSGQQGGGVYVKPVQWVDEDRIVGEDDEARKLQSSKVRDTRSFQGRKRQENVKIIRAE